MSAILPDRSASCHNNDHAPLVSALGTLYNLLADLGTIEHSAITWPPASGRYPDERINVTAAHDAGFGDQALGVLYRVPYLDQLARDVLLDYETTPLTYVDDGSASAFDFARDPTFQERTDLMAEHIVVLTQGRIGGTELIYDVITHRITAWDHFNDAEEWTEMPSYSMEDAQNPLYQWIISFLTLRRFHLSQTELVQPYLNGNWPDPNGPPDPELNGQDRQAWEREARSQRYKWTMNHVFVAAGWNVENAVRIIEGSSHDTARPIWERLEQARLAATKNFDEEDFARRKEQWETASPY